MKKESERKFAALEQSRAILHNVRFDSSFDHRSIVVRSSFAAEGGERKRGSTNCCCCLPIVLIVLELGPSFTSLLRMESDHVLIYGTNVTTRVFVV